MGKRAAAKPKATPKANQKRPKTNSAAVPPPPAPRCWGRAELPELQHEAEALRFFLVDIDDGPLEPQNAEHELRLYGTTAEGFSVCACVQGMQPYFYARCPVDVRGYEEDVRKALDAALPASLHGSGAVAGVEVVLKTPVLGFQPEVEMLRIKLAGPRIMNPCVKALEQGVVISKESDAGKQKVEVQSNLTFEANIPLVLRFLVDHGLGGGRWIELPPGSYHTKSRPWQTNSQLEVSAPCSSIKALPTDNEFGSSVPPVRSLALEVFTDADGFFCAAACALMVQGETSARGRAVWLRREPAPTVTASGGEWEEVKVDVYDPDQAEPPMLFLCDDEDMLITHLGQTLELIDADILLTHDLARTVHRLLGKKTAKPGSALARGLARLLSVEVKLTAKSNEVSGLAGRLGFDLQKQVEKEHRLTDYSLGGLSEHFCHNPLPELREADLGVLRANRPRAFAQYALRRSEAAFLIFDHLAFLFNFVEMARVTGCPLSFLLERGQAVKVQAQLLREARQRGFVLPSQRPGTGEETTFEGATVLEPACNFYQSPVAVLDFASLYPSIMMAHNLCYCTLLPGGMESRSDAPSHSMAPKPAVASDEGKPACFVQSSVRKGLLPSILEQLLTARRTAKKQLALCPSNAEVHRKVLNGRQLALKLSANSVYGFTGATNGPLPCLELAGAVTAYGREMIKATKAMVEKHFSRSNGYRHDAEVVYGDTDSVMVRFAHENIELEETFKLCHEAAALCSSAFPPPVALEFEKVYRPFLLMNKKRYAGLAWTSLDSKPKLEIKGIETVRRDWSDLVRQGVEQTLTLLLRADGSDGVAEATAYVRSLCNELRQNKIDFRSLVISKSLGRDEYAAKAPHVEVATKLQKRNPSSAPCVGDRVHYLVLAGAAKAKVYERAEDPLYALDNDLPIDAEYYLENQLKQPLLRIFEHVCGGPQKAEQALFTCAPGQTVVAATASVMRGMGKFVKPRPKCLDCSATTLSMENEALCGHCKAKGPDHESILFAEYRKRAHDREAELLELRAHCSARCSLTSDDFGELPPDVSSQEAAGPSGESCTNMNCQVIFRRVKAAKDLKVATDALARFKSQER